MSVKGVLALFVASAVLSVSAAVPAVERLATSLLPAETMNEVAGFFGPVTKRYQPVFEKFGAEYEASSDKMAIIAKYLPQAEKALAEAKKMKVPPRFQAEKSKYIRLFDTVMAAARLSVRLAGRR